MVLGTSDIPQNQKNQRGKWSRNASELEERQILRLIQRILMGGNPNELVTLR